MLASPHGYSGCTSFRAPTYFFCSDDALYMTMARYMIHGDFSKLLHPIWPPLFPFISGLVFLIVHNWAATPRIVSLLTGSLLVIPVYFLCLNYFSRIVAIIAGIIIALFSPLIISSVQPLSESLMLITLWTGIIFLLLSFKKKIPLMAFFCGVFFGLTALTRVEGIFSFGSFLVFFTISLLFKEIRTKQFFKLFLLVSIGFILIYEPYQLAMYNKFHTSMTLGKAATIFNFRSQFDLTQHGASSFGQDSVSIETVNPRSEIYSGFIDILFKRYETMFDDTITRLKLEANLVGSYLNSIKILLILFGFIFFIKVSIKNKEMLFLYIFFILTLLGSTFFMPSLEERYIYWFLPFIPILLALGFVHLIKAVSKYLQLRNYITIVVYILSLTLLFNAQLIDSMRYAVNLTSINQKPFIIPEDAWLMKNDPGKRVMMHHEGYGFYSQSFIVYTPNVATVADLVKYAHLWKVSYMVDEYGEVPDQIRFILDKPKDYPGLKLIKGKNILLYKIL